MAHTTSLERAEGLWFEGGTIVFQAETTIYRLFPGMLSGCSPFFRDLFEVPQPNVSETYEGLPLVKMIDDASKDVTPFFQAIFCPAVSSICLPETAKISLEYITAILRLSTKYNVEYLRYHALRHLRSRVPKSLAEYAARIYSWMRPKAALHLIPVLRSCNALWLLPLVYYLCANPGRVAGRGDLVVDMMEKYSSQSGINFSEERRIWHGRIRIVEEGNHIVQDWLTTVDCPSQVCAKSRAVWAEMYMDRDPFNTPAWHSAEDPATGKKELCDYCVRIMKRGHARDVQEIWNELPSYFGLPAWDVLSEMEHVEMEFVTRLAGNSDQSQDYLESDEETHWE